MKLLTFLGTTDYKLTIYSFGDRRHSTRYCPAAIAHFFHPETTLVVVTKDAEAKHFEQLADEVETVTHPVPVPIPDGHSEADLWAIFDALTNHVAEKDTLIVDITNGFRSLPFLSFLAVAYLRTVKKADVQGVYYGAWEARNDKNESPVFDLTPFVTLLDWTIATDRFIQTGDGRPLADLLRTAAHFEHPRRELTSQEQAGRDLSKRICGAAQAIEETSRALLTTLIPHAERASHLLSIRLAEAEADLASKAPPYRLLAERIRDAYTPFALENPMADQLETDLSLQLKMIGWYLDNGHIPQAATLMREWVVTAVGFRLGLRSPQILDYHTGRKQIEDVLGWAAGYQHQTRKPPADAPPRYAAAFQGLPDSSEIAKFWGRLTEQRNLIDHGAMKKNWADVPSQKIDKQIRELYMQLQRLAISLLEQSK